MWRRRPRPTRPRVVRRLPPAGNTPRAAPRAHSPLLQSDRLHACAYTRSHPATSTVELKHGTRRMDELRVGDLIRTPEG